MNKQFTASEVRQLANFLNTEQAVGAEQLHAYADRLEADERAVPMAYILKHEKRTFTPTIYYGEVETLQRAHGGEIVKLYPHHAPADAERLAEALRQAMQSLRTIERGAMREEGLEEAENVRAYARSRAGVAESALAAHSAQAQPPAVSVTDAMVKRALHARAPGGAQVWHWLPTEDGRRPHSTAFIVMRAALATALAAQENPNG